MDLSKQKDEFIEEEILEEVLEDDSDFDSENIPIFIGSETKEHQHFVAEKDEGQQRFDEDMLESLEDIGKHFFAVGDVKKETSPDADVIFINDKKVSINSLKKIKDSSLSDTVNSTSKVLDDITEESDVESKGKNDYEEHHQIILPDSSLTEKGTILRKVLKTCLSDQHDEDDSDKSVIEREKDHEYQNLISSLPHFSIATTSTEYRTMHDYFNSTLSDADNEYSDSESVVKNLKTQLSESKQEQTKLINEIEFLKSKFSGDLCKNLAEIEQEVLLDDNSEFSNNTKEQAKKEVLFEIEENIKTLLSGNFQDDSNWPPELILLREKLTASNQLEIAQLKIKHEEEMSRIKNDYDIELQRKLKRHAAFDENRDLEKIISERDNLRELSASLRFTLCELAKCINQYESDNLQLSVQIDDNVEEKDDQNLSTISVNTKRFVTFKPDVTNLIAVVEDPQLLNFVSKNAKELHENSLQINIVDCLNRLKSEANNILELSEKITQQNLQSSILADNPVDKADSCEEEDGLKTHFFQSLETFNRNEINTVEANKFKSLPATLNNKCNTSDAQKSVADRSEDDKTSSDNFNESYLEDFSIKSPSHIHKKSLSDIKSKAKELLSTSTNLNSSFDAYQIIEDFCRETDNFIENENQLRVDLQKQLEVADKQIKSNKRFLEEQAMERDQERDEFVRELEQVKTILKERERDRISIENYERKISNYEDQIKDLSGQLQNLSVEKQKFEQDLKNSIDKVFDLREIISNLEGQIQSKDHNENNLVEKIENLEAHIGTQSDGDEMLRAKENEYIERIAKLEEELKLIKPANEQKMLLQQMTSQLKTIEMILDRKTKTLEAFHALSSTCSNTACSSPSEDVSRGYEFDISDKSPIKIWKAPTEGNALPLEEISRILEKFSKHNRMEEATVKKVTDLEMTLNVLKNNFSELQQEKDMVEERISEQLLKISSLQSRLDEQRIQSEELNKQNNSDLTLRVHDLINELAGLKEILLTRDKQISNLNQLLEHSKTIIESQDHELASGNDKSSYDRLNEEIKCRDKEINLLKEKIKTEMINKAVIPDLMETMIAEKNEEIDNLRDKIDRMAAANNHDMTDAQNSNSVESAFRRSIQSEFEEPEVLRRAVVVEKEIPIIINDNTLTKNPQFTMSSCLSEENEFFTDKATISTSQDNSQMMVPSYLVPRKINFNSTDDHSTMDHANKINNELQQTCIEMEKLKLSVDEQSKEIANLQCLLQTKEKLYADINDERNKFEEKTQSLAAKCQSHVSDLKAKDEEMASIKLRIQDLEFAHNQDLEQLRAALNEKEEINHKLSEDLMGVKNKLRENERVLGDLDGLKKQVSSYNELVVEKDSALRQMELDMLNYVKNEEILLNKADKYEKLLDLNKQLEVDIESLRKELCAKAFSVEKYKIDLDEMEKQIQSLRSNDAFTSLNHQQQREGEMMTTIDIASKLDKELSYSAELDGNIVEAIRSESEISSELDEIGNRKSDQVIKELKNLKLELDHYKEKYRALLNELDEERKYFNDIHQQDGNLIESMNLRLKLALDNESTFKKMLESEKLKNVTGLQRTKSFDNNLLFKESNHEFDMSFFPKKPQEYDAADLVQRLRSEIQFLSSQKDGERDRVLDLQCALERERERFKKSLMEQQIYIDQLKKEIQLQLNSNQNLRMELEEKRSNEVIRRGGGADQFGVPDIEHLEEQNHYLIGRFMRSESFRKALIFQKKFLLITLSTKIGILPSSLYRVDPRKRKTFRSIALLVIAVERFKFIAKRWTGKRVISQASSNPLLLPKRSQSASNNLWVRTNFRTFNNPQQPSTQPKISKQSQLIRIQNLFHDN